MSNHVISQSFICNSCQSGVTELDGLFRCHRHGLVLREQDDGEMTLASEPIHCSCGFDYELKKEMNR